MNWKRILLFAAILVALPTVVGFVFGLTNLLWQKFLDPEAARWLRWATIAGLTLVIYTILTATQWDRRTTHLLAVFGIAETTSTVLHLGLGGTIGSAAIWSVVSAVAAVAGYVLAGMFTDRRRRAV